MKTVHTSSRVEGWRLKAVAATAWLCFSVCHADVVEGTVTDSTSNQAIANVLVQEAGTGNVTLTDTHGRFALEINAAIIRPRYGQSPTNPAPDPSAPAIVSRKSGYATRWTSVALGDTNITLPLARELEAPGPNPALFANPYYVRLRNFYVAPPPAGNDANDGTSPQSCWATLTKANLGRVAGDCVNLAPGTYQVADEVTITSGGSASTPAGYVVYRSARMGAAHLVAAARLNHMIRITTHHVMFDGIDFDGNNFRAGLCGLDVERSPDYHHIWVMNSQVHGFGQSGIQENGSEWFWNLHNHVFSNACTVRIDWQGSGISHVVPAAVPNYTPSAMDNYWAPFHLVTAYNLIHDNYGQQGLYAGKNTDGNGIIYDTFRSYAGQSLCLGNIAYHNGGKGIHVFRSGHVTVANNTAYNNNWDTCNPGTWRAEIWPSIRSAPPSSTTSPGR